MKVLVVDDELVSRKKMEIIMATFGECIAVDSGPAALDAFETAIEKGEPFDLIALDVSMPQMDGIEVLCQIRRIEQQRNIPKEQQPKVVMVTAQSDTDTVITSIQAGCDSYIVKPFDKTIIACKLKELGMSAPEPVQEVSAIRKMVMDTIRKFKQGKTSLPVLPQILEEIENAMGNATLCTDELADILERDAVVSTKVIATANSSFYHRGGDKVQDLDTAILRLGTKEIQSIVSAIASRGLYESKSEHFNELLKKLWLHSLSCAYCCRAISVKLGDRDSGKVFLMGLTHDLGCALLLKSIGDSISHTVEFDRNDLMESLREVHVSFGAALLEEWGFDREFSDVVKLHKWNSFEQGTKKEILIVNLAENMSTSIQFGFFDGDADLSNLESAKLLEIDPGTLEEMAEEIKGAMKEAEKIFC
jgi:HD-like signal output (HDOD) protein